MEIDTRVDKIMSTLNAHKSVRDGLNKLTPRDLALLHQTLWHILERAYLDGYDARAPIRGTAK